MNRGPNGNGIEPGSVVLGRCDLCEQDVAHDERGAEFVYAAHDLLRLERVACARCAAQYFGGLPPGTTRKQFVAHLVKAAGEGAKPAAEEIAARLAGGEHVPSEEIAGLLGLTTRAKQRNTRTLTTAEERLRRHREAEAGKRRAGKPPGPSRETRRRLRKSARAGAKRLRGGLA